MAFTADQRLDSLDTRSPSHHSTELIQAVRPLYKTLLIIAGTTCMVAAIAIDAASANLILRHELVSGLAVHAASVAVWLIGFFVLKRPQLTGEATVMGALVLCLFPALGTAGLSFAIFAVALFGSPSPEIIELDTNHDLEHDSLSDVLDGIAAPFDPLAEVDVQPLARSLGDADTATKRSALDLICREPNPRGLLIVRQLLADADLDVRALAATAVSKLEAHFNERVQEASRACQENPYSADCHVDLARLLTELGCSPAFDEATHGGYLRQACSALERAAQLDPDRADVRMLTVQIALAKQGFSTVSRLARRAYLSMTDTDPDLPLAEWWSGVETPRETQSS